MTFTVCQLLYLFHFFSSSNIMQNRAELCSTVNAMGRFNYLKIVPRSELTGLGRGSPLPIVDTELQIVTNGQNQGHNNRSASEETSEPLPLVPTDKKQLPDNTQSLSFSGHFLKCTFVSQIPQSSNCL